MNDAVVLITGARKGIGRYLAEHYVRRGAQVVGCSRSEPDWSLEHYTHFCVDVTHEADVRKMVTSVHKRFGRLDVLVNNAGIASMNHVLLTPAATAERIFATNVQGVFLLCREAAKVMQRRRYGRIVNISTVAAPLHLEGEALYAASKSAVVTFTQILAREVAAYGITANVVAPTPIETDLIRAVPQEKIDAIINRLAVKRLGRFEDVANVIDFFVRPESDYITGQVITLGGVS
ncbi:MAG: SDR family oxidoreductase [Caldilineaceae bacterium]|jgi:3-oxoacyl-[acyl-carrier protein] reductase|nr:SDR family oxidoreductase [Caldilineaceae bacterium]